MGFRKFLEDIERSGVITAHNPMGEPASADYNRAANARLRKDLSGHEPKEVEGIYNGHPEKSFLIPRIERTKLLSLGRKYQQKAVVWDGQIFRVKDNEDGREISGN